MNREMRGELKRKPTGIIHRRDRFRNNYSGNNYPNPFRSAMSVVNKKK
jgi:hypothetical protein